MAAVPKRKISKARGRRRRAHQALKAPRTVKCPHCGAEKLTHRECPECGKYKNLKSQMSKGKTKS